ncbi:MAG: Hpt domain-containing protein [Planctomycetaceae bacterium]|nr:Hpt domain-containing protein [Planctomycetaceae bacterium]
MNHIATNERQSSLYSVLANDPDLCELVRQFVDEMPGRIQKLTAEWNALDWENLLRTTHQLKGAAGSYGFGEISPAAASLEELIKSGSPESEIAQSVASLVSLCKLVSAEPHQK